jgi:hypothetical protein
MRTTLSNSITFNSDGTVFSQDGTELNRAVRPANAMSDTQKAGVNIQTRTSDFASITLGQAQPPKAPPPFRSNFFSRQAWRRSLAMT